MIRRPPRSTRTDTLFPYTTLFRSGDELSETLLKTLAEAGAKEVSILAIDHINVGAYIRNTLAVDKNTSREEAIIDIYRGMRPGEPPKLETAEAMFKGLFFDSDRYDLSADCRVKMHERLDRKSTRLKSSHSCATSMQSYD